MDAFCHVIVARGDNLGLLAKIGYIAEGLKYLNDFIAGKFKLRNVSSVTSHQVTVKYSENAFVGNY